MLEGAGRPLLQADLPYELAGWGQRAGASLLDVLVMLIPGAAMFMLLDLVPITHGDLLAHASWTAVGPDGYAHHVYGVNLLGWICWLFVMGVAWGLQLGRAGARNGQTFGRSRIGIRVVADNGRELSPARGLARFVIQAVLFLVFIVPGVIDSLWALVDAESRTVHDLICGTHVVRVTPAPATWAPAQR